LFLEISEDVALRDAKLDVVAQPALKRVARDAATTATNVLDAYVDAALRRR
jgi:hypothetical protein